MADEKAFAFDPFDQFTIVVTTPVGVEVMQAKYSELHDVTVPALGPGIAVEVIPPAGEDGTQLDSVYLSPGQTVQDAADRFAVPVVPYDPLANHPQREETPNPGDFEVDFVPDAPLVAAVAEAPKPARRSGPQAAMGPVGPDPEQEAAKRVTVKAVTGATGPKGKRS